MRHSLQPRYQSAVAGPLGHACPLERPRIHRFGSLVAHQGALLLRRVNIPSSSPGSRWKMREPWLAGPVAKPVIFMKISRVIGAGSLDSFVSSAIVDRLRDIVRRAILARLFIAATAPQLWPADDDATVDRAILTEAGRAALRTAWRTPLIDLDQHAAVEAARVVAPLGGSVIDAASGPAEGSR